MTSDEQITAMEAVIDEDRKRRFLAESTKSTNFNIFLQKTVQKVRLDRPHLLNDFWTKKSISVSPAACA